MHFPLKFPVPVLFLHKNLLVLIIQIFVLLNVHINKYCRRETVSQDF
jgi:hypothetical protein